MKKLLTIFSAAALLLAGCTDDPGDEKKKNPGDEGGVDLSKPEYTYTPVDYIVKKNGAWPNGWENSLSQETRTVGGMNWMAKASKNENDKWGGNPNLKVTDIVSTNTAGFWRTGRVGDRWYMVDPDGNAAILHGLNGVNPDPARDGSTIETKNNYNILFGGDVERWAEFAGSTVLGEYEFNFFTVGPRRPQYYWNGMTGFSGMTEGATASLRSPKSGAQNGQVETLFMLRTFSWDYYSIYKTSFSTNEYNIFVLLFDPKLPEYLDNLAAEVTAPFRDSKNFIGYYTDNELPFNSYQDKYPLKGIELEHFLTLEDKFDSQFAGARKFAEDFMKGKGVEPVVKNITKALRDEFRYEVARYYYKTMTEALRKHDPNHLILGSRLFDSSMYNEWTIKACAEYCDVVSVNYYNYWQPQEEYCIGQIQAWTGNAKPFMVTEFYVKDITAAYGSTPYENMEGAGWKVRDQKSRGWYYQNFCIRLLEMGNCVGWQWFEFMDNYGQGDSSTYTGSNKGVISAQFLPYYDCLEIMRELHRNIYRVADYYDAKKDL